MDKCPEKKERKELNLHPLTLTHVQKIKSKKQNKTIENIWTSDLKLTNSAVFL